MSGVKIEEISLNMERHPFGVPIIWPIVIPEIIKEWFTKFQNR
jgi:hypothetical protein